MKKNALGKGIVAAWKDGYPLAVSTFVFGVAYGMLALQAGFSMAENIAMSAIVFAGSAQVVTVNLYALGTGAGGMILAVFLVNLRHLLMGASLAPYLKKYRTGLLAVAAFGLTDESYAIAIRRFQRCGGSLSYFIGAGSVVYIPWLLGSWLGGMGGGFIGNPTSYGMDFAFIAAFIALLIPQIKGYKEVVVFIVSSATALTAACLLPGQWYIILAGIAAMACGVAMPQEQVREEGVEKGAL